MIQSVPPTEQCASTKKAYQSMLQTLQIYSINSHGQSTRDGPPVWRLVRVEQPPPGKISMYQCYMAITGCSIRVHITSYYKGHQINEDEMGGACGTRGGEEKCMQGFDEET